MSLSSLSYDKKAYMHKLRESMGPAAYIFESNPTNAYTCDAKDKEETNNDLLGITRKASECPSEQFLPTVHNKNTCPTPPQLGYTPDFVRVEHTKVSNPPSTLRGKGINRFSTLCEDPQDYAINPFHFQIQDSVAARDNHQPIIPKPVDVKTALPIPAGNLPVENYTFVPTPTLPVILPNTKDEIYF